MAQASNKTINMYIIQFPFNHLLFGFHIYYRHVFLQCPRFLQTLWFFLSHCILMLYDIDFHIPYKSKSLLMIHLCKNYISDIFLYPYYEQYLYPMSLSIKSWDLNNYNFYSYDMHFHWVLYIPTLLLFFL